MASHNYPRPRPRPAHIRGATYLSYTPDGTKLISVGSNNTTRVYKTGFDGEPTNIDDCPEQNAGVASTNDFFVIGSEDGNISMFSLQTMSYEKYLTRCSLPIRDLALTPDGKWCAVASDELAVKIVDTEDCKQVMTLREQPKPIKHLSFDPNGSYISLSCTDGVIYVYSLLNKASELVRKIDGLIRAVETDDEIWTGVVWHPDGRAFAAPTATRDIQVVSIADWEFQRKFANGHDSDILAMAWSPNGSMLVSTGKDKKIQLWETKTQKIITTYNYANVMDLAWHPSRNLFSFSNTEGEVYIYNNFVPSEYSNLLELPLQPAPFYHDPLHSQSNLPIRSTRRQSQDSLDDILGPELIDDEDDFVVDDDGAGYALGRNQNGKRTHAELENFESDSKRLHQSWEPKIHKSFQPGSTPWRGNRKYLCLNLIGFVWTVDQDTHNTITVEFYDHEYYRDFHFTDTFLYDKACLNEHGALFSCPSQNETSAIIFYRPHETWTARADWRTEIPLGENITAISMSDSFVTVITTANYIRIYTLFGVPLRVCRLKSSPVVTCVSWRNYVLTLGNGPIGADGHTKLLYSIQNIKRDEICQNEDTVALPPGATLKTVFFSDNGDPFIYDSTSTLLTLLHWRIPAQAQWVPVLDTRLLSRLASGRKSETYFAVAVSENKFHCIILKGGDQYPYFPRPLLSEFEFEVPLFQQQSDGGKVDSDHDIMKKLELDLVLNNILKAQQQDLIENTQSSAEERARLQRTLVEIDKTLLKMINIECRESEERGMRALEMVKLIQDKSGRMIEAAVKIAERYDRAVLIEKISEIGESLLAENTAGEDN
ncbi:unnamed protein product [Blumeria hordei]|uniref:Uncharacterized protein n=1 Tax=Blumeria hordei TaxID=2867405 RepID=A0A383V0A7_BLUHO|nr:unnamed protein product [Blumeria hordei]